MNVDKMIIGSRFTRNILNKLIEGILRKKTGCDIGIEINDADVSVIDRNMYVHLNVDVKLNNSEIMKILKSKGLD